MAKQNTKLGDIKYVKHPIKNLTFKAEVIGIEFPGFGRTTLILKPVAGEGQDRFDARSVSDEADLPIVQLEK